MQLTPTSYSAGFIAIYLLNVVYTDAKPIDEIKKRHLQTESFGILELDLDDSVVRQIYEDKLLSKLKDDHYEDDNEETRNNTGSNLQTRLVTFGQQTNVNNQVANLLSNQISNQITNQLTNELTNVVASQIPMNQNDMAVVSVAIPQATLQRTVGNAIANQLFINGNQKQNQVINEEENNLNHNQTPQNQILIHGNQNNLDQNQSSHKLQNGKTSLHLNSHIHNDNTQKYFKHPDSERIKFSVPNSVPIVIKLKDKMVVNRKVKKIHKKKHGVNEDIHIIW